MLNQMSDKILAVMENFGLPGMVIGTLHDGEYETQTFGVKDVNGVDTVVTDTVYGIGSISKVFTATLAMRLVQKGLLDLDRPVVRYVPTLTLTDQDARQSVTMRHLLTHQAGFEGDGFIENGTDENALAEWVGGFTDLQQVTPAGATWSYSNTGFGLAGYVIAQISGWSYEDAMRSEVLAPLGLARTGFGQPPAFENSATGYEFGKDGATELRVISGCARSSNPAGGLVSTAPDLLRFAAAHLGLLSEVPFLSDDLRRSMQTPQADVSAVEKWGIGWGLKLEGGSEWSVEHGGWFNGFRAQLTLLSSINSALVILTTGPKGHEAIEHVQGMLLEDVFGIHEIEPDEASSFARPHRTGLYTQSHIRAEFFTDEADELTMYLKTKWHGEESSDPVVCPMMRVSDDEYVVSGGEFVRSRVTFVDHIPGSAGSGVRVLNRICLLEDQA